MRSFWKIDRANQHGMTTYYENTSYNQSNSVNIENQLITPRGDRYNASKMVTPRGQNVNPFLFSKDQMKFSPVTENRSKYQYNKKSLPNSSIKKETSSYGSGVKGKSIVEFDEVSEAKIEKKFKHILINTTEILCESEEYRSEK